MNNKVNVAIASCMAAVLAGCGLSQETVQVKDTIVVDFNISPTGHHRITDVRFEG